MCGFDAMRMLWVSVITAFAACVVTGCDSEKDDLIPEPSETSTVITGYIRTPGGTPLANVPVSLDYKVIGFLGTSVVHKAKGTSDKSGFYKIFFEANEKPGMGLQSGYMFTVDLSVLSSDKYVIASKVDFDLPIYTSGEWGGDVITCNFTVPLKKLVKVRVVNDGVAVTEGRYAVKIMFPFLDDGGPMYDVQNFWDTEGMWRVFEDIEIPAAGSTTVTVAMAVGEENGIKLVYLGDATHGYPNGIPASEARVEVITGGFNDEIVLQ